MSDAPPLTQDPFPERGRFITFEGGEGAGKSTQVRLLAEALRAMGRRVVTTREPGGSPGAEEIRGLLLSGGADKWDGVTELLLHSAARRDHVRKVVLPALEQGEWVICDRFIDSTRAYQGYGHGVDAADISDAIRLSIGDLRPDLTLILDMDVEEGLRRAHGRGQGHDRYERMGTAFHERLRQGFLTIGWNEPSRCAVIDAARPVEDVAGDVLAAAGRLLPERHVPGRLDPERLDE